LAFFVLQKIELSISTNFQTVSNGDTPQHLTIQFGEIDNNVLIPLS